MNGHENGIKIKGVYHLISVPSESTTVKELQNNPVWLMACPTDYQPTSVLVQWTHEWGSHGDRGGDYLWTQ